MWKLDSRNGKQRMGAICHVTESRSILKSTARCFDRVPEVHERELTALLRPADTKYVQVQPMCPALLYV